MSEEIRAEEIVVDDGEILNENETKDFDETRDLVLLNDDFKKEDIMGMVKELEDLGRKIEVGGQTSYQNRNFVLNPTEFPEGTVGKSRQAVFEGAVRVDSLKGLVFDYHKTLGEIKKCKAEMMKQESIMNNTQSEPWEVLEAEGAWEIARAELRQKELAVEGMQHRSKHLLRSIHDFHSAFKENEEITEKRGMSVLDWNKPDVEHDYWSQVNDRKVIKQLMYQQADLSKEGGDSLPFQNRLDVGRVNAIKNEVGQQAARLGYLGPQAHEVDQRSLPQGKVMEQMSQDPPQSEMPASWTIEVEGVKVNAPNGCPVRDGKKCTFRKQITGMCDYLYCQSLGIVQQ